MRRVVAIVLARHILLMTPPKSDGNWAWRWVLREEVAQ